MSQFRYSAFDEAGRLVSGTVTAASRNDAQTQLEARGLRIPEPDPHAKLIELPRGDDPAPAELSEADFSDVVHRVNDVVQTGLPLAPGLRALAEEAPSRRLKRALREISDRLEAGEPLPDVLAQSGRSVPAHLRGLLEAALRTGNLGLIMQQYLTFTRTAVDLRRRVWMSFVYPIILVLGLGAVATFLLYLVVPEFKDIFEGFGTELPAVTVFLILASDFVSVYGPWILAGIGLAFLLGWQIIGLAGGRAVRARIAANLPLIGPMFQFESLARFCYLLSILIEHHVALADALRMAGAGTNDANLHRGCTLLAEEVEHGEQLRHAAAAMPHFPASLVHVFRWERRQDAFIDALRAAGESFAARANLQTGLVGVVFEPVLVVGMAVLIGGAVMALFLPLIKLLNDLS